MRHAPSNEEMREVIKCWEFFQCEEKKCPVYGSDDPRCWLVSGTLCRKDIQDRFIEKLEMCLVCEVFKVNMTLRFMDETLKVVHKQFTDYKRKVEERDRRLEDTNKTLSKGLSEVFDAPKRIAEGDPWVRIPETSKLELVAQLKHNVNLTAQNVSEIVDLSHEFAIGLAEHFDVLRRVSKGDLTARVSGNSWVDLLESLKNVTNRTIDVVAEEIDDRRRAEEALLGSEKRFRELSITDGLTRLYKHMYTAKKQGKNRTCFSNPF